MPEASPRLPGLRIDVDTHDGMKLGVPRLLDLLGEHGVKGTFYLSMGPDNSGRAILNVLRRPGFLAKMRRTDAARVYGWRTVLSGTLLPARMIAVAHPEIARRISAEGHEAGVHAWNHRRWQDRLPRLSDAQVADELRRGRDAFIRIFASAPRTFAAPAWFSDERALAIEDTFGLEYASDCRGGEPFVPVVAGKALATPQVPATLPTLDEALGESHGDAASFFTDILEAASRQTWPVLTIHAELEGGPYAQAFAAFLRDAEARGNRIVPLRELLAARLANGVPLPICAMGYGTMPGRHGRVSVPVLTGDPRA